LSNHVNVAPPIVLTIAGFDPSAGAGVAADLKTIAAHNCYGVAAITALTVQSTQGVKSVHDTPATELRAQLDTLLEDIKISAIKIGMLGHRGNAVVVAEFLDRAGVANVVLDPVMKSTSGETDLIDAGGIKYIGEELLKRATVVTPNIAEAESRRARLSSAARAPWSSRAATWRKRSTFSLTGRRCSASAAITSRMKTRTDLDAHSRRLLPHNSPAGARCEKPSCSQKRM
jgi:hydroxymethylpyrimidine/phosphomethylpyrimidine kinase